MIWWEMFVERGKVLQKGETCKWGSFVLIQSGARTFTKWDWPSIRNWDNFIKQWISIIKWENYCKVDQCKIKSLNYCATTPQKILKIFEFYLIFKHYFFEA